MNTLTGYSKSTLTDQYLLTAAGGHLAVNDLLTDKLLDYVTLTTEQTITGHKKFDNQLTIKTNSSKKTPKIVLDEYYNPNTWVSEIISDYFGTNVCDKDGFSHGLYIKLGRENPFDNLYVLDYNKTPIARISKCKGHYFDGTMKVTSNIMLPNDSSGLYLYNGCGIEKWKGYGPTLIAEDNNLDFFIRGQSDRTNYKRLLHSGNYSNYLPFLNSSSTHATNASVIYAPTTAGTKGLILTSNGSGAPSWMDPSTIAVGKTKVFDNLYTNSTRPTSLNIQFGDGGLRTFKATRVTTEGKCTGEGHIIHLAWDSTNGWDNQLAITCADAGKNFGIQFRGQNEGTWSDWHPVLTDLNYHEYLGYIGTTTVLASSKILALTGISSIFVNTGDATLKVYNGGTSESNDGTICLLTSIDGTDGLSHAYPTLYQKRCNLALLPRGGSVYIGTVPEQGTNTYKLWVLGSSMHTGAISSDLNTRTHLNGNKGTAIINSTAAAGYNMLAKMNSTNGVFTIGAYDNEFNLYYTTNATIAAETNSTTYRAQLLNESGNTVFPGRLYVGSLLNVNNNYFNYGLAVLDSRTATVTGTIVITLPVGFTNSMNTYEIDIYEYNGYDSTLDNTLYSKLIISGYNYTETSSWVNCGYVQLGSYAKGVRLGYNGSKCCILLGTTSSTWKYPKIRLSRVLTAHDGASNFNTGYSISTITSESGYSKIVYAYRLKLRFERVVATEFTGSLAKTLTFAAGTFADKTYNNSADVTVNIPTKTSHLTNDSGFLTAHQSLTNYVTLNSALTISAKKTFSVQLEFTVASGTAPFTVTSSTKVTNLNADTVDGFHVTGGDNKPWGTIVAINSNGVSEMGRYIDFHYDNTTASDYSTRLLCSGNHSNVITLPSATGTLALTSQLPSVGNGTITINLAGSQVGTFTVNLSGNTTINLTDNNTWRGITDSYTGTDSTISLSQKGANDLLKTVVTYAKGTSYVGASFNNSELSTMAADHYIEYWDSAGGWFNSRWGLVLTISGFKKVDYDDTYVLLAGGGHKALSDLSATHSHSYLPLNTSTVNTLTSSQMGVLNCNSTDTVGTGIRLYNNGNNKGGLWWGSSYGIYLYNATTQDYLGLEDNGALYFYDKSANNNQGVKYILLHTGNADDRYIKTTGGIIANANTGLYINRTTAGTNAHMTFLVNGTSVGDIGVSYDKKPVFYDYDASAWVRLVTQSFNGNITATAFYSSSDINLKTNIHDLTSSDNIPLLKEFDWKEDGSHSYGLIAQELEDMGYYELVTEVEDHKTVNYSAALSLIVGKLQVKIKELEKEIENLKNKN